MTNKNIDGEGGEALQQRTALNTEEGTSLEEELDRGLALFDFPTELPEKQSKIMRIFYNNCNGLEINKAITTVIQGKTDKKTHGYIKDIEAPTKIDGLIRQMKAWNVDIVNLSETCVAWEDSSPRRTIQQITKKYDTTGCWTVSSSSISVGNFLKPGGTGILTMNEFPGKMIERGTDPWKMGRWSYITLSGKDGGSNLTIITGYRVGKRSSSPGASTAWTQQRTLLCKNDRNEEPHQAFLTDLKKWLTNPKFAGNEILLMLDANEQWDENSEMKKFSDEMNLSNINKAFQLKPTHPNIIYPSRSTTIDFCLGSANIIEHITYAGSTPYDLDILGDHRGFILDLDIENLLGKIERGTQLSHRKLVMSNPKAVDKYIEIVTARFEKQNIQKRARKLYKRVLSGHTDIRNMMSIYDKLDREVFGICTKAEKLCRPTIAGNYEWSPKLAFGIKTLSYWRHRLKHSTETPIIKKLGNELKILYTDLSETTIHQQVNDSYVKLKEIQKEARKHRQQHLSDLADKYARQHNLSQTTAITELLSHEETRHVFSELRSKLRPVHRGQLKQLWISLDEHGNYSKEPESRRKISDTTQIHKALLKRNAQHLSQASSTPFAKGQFRKGLKWDGTGKLSDDILSGNILQESKFSAAMQLYLESLQSKSLDKMKIIKPVLSYEEYRNFWKKKRENTVTSPYGLHVGHYKVAVSYPTILEVHRILLLIPFKLGMVPERWRRTVQIMLEKEQGAPWIHRLRIIELFDAQANAGFQIFIGRKLIQQAVNSKSLQMESYGSTPGKTAAGAVIQKMVSLDQLRLERRAGGIFDCDASGCYDRIIPPLASVHLQSLGLDRSIGTFLARFMFQAKRHVRTGNGISKEHIRTTKRRVLHGIGQGNGGGPAIWLSHLTVMLAAISTVCAGFYMYCVQQIHKISTVGTGYVDDVTLGLALPKDTPQNEATVRRHIRKMSQLWEKLLHISGGRLELSKCFWVPITWRWSKGKPKLHAGRSGRNKDLSLRESETNSTIKIPRLTCKEASKRLGIWTNCEATWTKEYKSWKVFSQQFGHKIKNARLGRVAGYQAYHAMWLAKFRFSAPVIGLQPQQIQKLKQSITAPCLSAAGYCSKMPRAVVFGPSKYGGMDWENPATICLYEKIKFLLGSIRLQDVVGQLLLIQLSWMQLYAGISIPILEYNKSLDYLPPGWIKNLHEYLVDSTVQIELFGGWVPARQREHDAIIMDYVLHHTPSWMWSAINRCRLFLKVTTLADLTTIDGRQIPSKIRKVKKAIRKSNLSFPLQLRPPAADISYWKYFIDLISEEGTLHSPLGRWLRTPDQQHTYMITPTSDTVYKRQGLCWRVFRRKSPSSRRYTKLRLRVDTIPAQCVPAPVIELSQHLIVKTDELAERLSLVESNLLDVRKIKKTQWRSQVVGKSRTDQSQLSSLETQWKADTCTIICATDGSLKDTVGTSSYAFFLPQETEPFLEGSSVEHQPQLEASSTRQELLGQLAAEYWLHDLRQKWGTPRRPLRFILVTDSKASMEIMKSVPLIIGMSDTLTPEMDVALELFDLQGIHQWIERKIVKVTSHIEKEQSPDPFLWECNDRADKLATAARELFSSDEVIKRVPILFPGTRVGCRINGRIENNSLYRHLKHKIDGDLLTEYLCNKYGWTQSIFHTIAWTAHHREMNKFPKPTRATLIKYIHGWLATKKRGYITGNFTDPNCPLCGNTETALHSLQCPHEQLAQLRQARWAECKKALCKQTPVGVQQVFLEGLRQAFTVDTLLDVRNMGWPSNIQAAYEAQQKIGWMQVFYGRIALKWETIITDQVSNEQEVYQYRWTGKMVRLFWDYGLDLWRIRNTLVHGTPGELSNVDKHKIDLMVQATYRNLGPCANELTKEFFSIPERDRMTQSYKSKRAWLSSVKILFPDQFYSLETSVVGRLPSSLTTD